MPNLQALLANNKAWSELKTDQDPAFFKRLSQQQNPEYLWIGCSDSRVPANDIVGLEPGELFVHRNIANAVQDTDFNCLSVLQYAVEVLKVKHIIVCGHYGCGGIQAAMSNNEHGLVDNWLRQIKDLYANNRSELSTLSHKQCVDKLAEINVAEQVTNLAKTKIVQHAWLRNQSLAIHGWIYGITNGLVKNLNLTINSIDDVDPAYQLKPTGPENRPAIVNLSISDSES